MSEDAENPVTKIALAYQQTAALVAAIKLDIFTLVGSGTTTAEALAKATEASPRGIRILCDYLTAIGLLTKTPTDYGLGPAARQFLDKSSPTELSSCIDFLAAPVMLDLALKDPVAYVRRGGSEGLANIAPDHPIWVQFARSMTSVAGLTAKRVASYVTRLPQTPATILDVAAGHGLYGIEAALVSPGAVVTAIDWSAVLELAGENAAAAGIADRYRMVAGSALELEWGSDFDLILLPNFLHHFDRHMNTSILRKAKSSLSPEGQVLVVDFVPNEDRTTPPTPAKFAFWMLASTPGGDAYTLADYDEMGRAAGFLGATARPLRPTPETLVIFQN